MNWMLAVTTGVVFGAGVYHVLQRDALRLVLGVSLVLGAVNLFLLGCAAFQGTDAPYGAAPAAVDPVPQVLVLTAVVIGFGVLAVLLLLVLGAVGGHRSLDVDRYRDLRG